MIKACRFLTLGIAPLVLAVPLFSQTNNEIFERLLGPAARMDPAVAAIVLKSPPGSKFRYDTDGDGNIDTIYFIDTDERHSADRQPLLVKVVDEDGDMGETGEGDRDSDLYVADWNGDGTIDRAVDYLDLDRDQDVDEEVQYRWHENLPLREDTWEPFVYNGRAYSAFWARDVGDDNRLLFHRNYEYEQETTQWQCDFNGDEIIVYAFLYDVEHNRLVPGWENPFCWYDLDGDDRAEEVVRLTGNRGIVRNLRYSWDIDNDNGEENPRDYDLSLTALGPISYGEEACFRLVLRGLPTGRVNAWEKARALAKGARWTKTHLTFDENDNNIDPREGQNHNERWEGVLNHPNEYFPQVGGPSCGPFNKRNEVDGDHSGGFRFYYSAVDRRWHLFGAEVGWIKADVDYDDRMDMEIRFEDLDGDGFFDHWKYDLDGDGEWDREVRVEQDEAELVPFEYDRLHRAYVRELEPIIEENRRLIEAMKLALREIEQPFAADQVEVYFAERLAVEYDRGFKLGEKIKKSREANRYYGDLIRERYFLRLLRAGKGKIPDLEEILEVYEKGQYGRAADLLVEKLRDRSIR